MKKKRCFVLVAMLTVLVAVVFVCGKFLLGSDRSAVIDEAQNAVVSAYEKTTNGQKDDTYLCPVDFEALQAVNSEIIAWLYIPGSDVNFPILQHDGEDGYYLSHNVENKEDENGAVFTEKTYNAADFTDPVTLIYAHRDGDFGVLQPMYSEEGGIEQYPEIIIYLPEREMHYTVFAAVPYDNRHILYNYDFTSARMYTAFLRSILEIRDIGAQFEGTMGISTEDRLVVLSTCLYGDEQRRYLVLAKCVDIVP